MTAAAASTPILLLPFRLETRFGTSQTGAPQLWVRLFPDQISIDTHEEALTSDELAAGTAYWGALWRLGVGPGSDERPAWRVLAQTFGPTRAAWIASRMTPTNLAQRPASATPDGQQPNPMPTYPTLAAEDQRASAWTRAPFAVGLPVQWTVVLYAGGAVKYTQIGNPIPRSLAVGPTPGAPSVNADAASLQIDADMRWMVDFDVAVQVGMAVAIDITPADLAKGFDRVIAYGLASGDQEPPSRATTAARYGASATASANTTIARLLNAHHYTDGLAFLPQGTATNNTDDSQRRYSSDDPGFDRSFRVERQGALASGDGAIVASYLGVPESLFEHVEFSDRREQDAARQMAAAVWPSTLGYTLRQLLGDDITPAHEEAARTFVRDCVHGRGPLPALRIADTPYGILPVTSLARWNQVKSSAVPSTLPTFLQRMLPIWLRSETNAPHLTRSGDPDQELLDVLGMDASAQSYRARHGLLDDVVVNTLRFLRTGDEAEWLDDARTPARNLLDRLGYLGWDPRLIHVFLSRRSFEVPYPIIQDYPVSETDGLATFTSGNVTGNYITWLRTASVDDIKNEQYPGGSPPTSLLYKVLRQSVLLEYANAAFDLGNAAVVRRAEAERVIQKEPALVGFTSIPVKTAWQALDAPVPSAGGQPAKVFLHGLSADQTGATTAYARLGELRSALDGLATLPTAELERLFTESLDCFSHRLDAWITSLATSALMQRRAAGTTATLLGAFAWVEDLRRAKEPAEVTGSQRSTIDALDAGGQARPERAWRSRPYLAAQDNGGFIHAPSLAQAEAGAVLRNGYLTHRGTSNGKLLAIDLSSERMRVALSLIDGVRQGQPLGALLGYRFESALHDASLDTYIDGFRARFPLVANKVQQPGDPAPTSGPAQTVAAANVVDGLALHRAWSKGASIWGDESPASGDGTKVDTQLGALDDVIDALGDLSISEGVYQVMRGNFTRAGGLLDALSRGEYAPDPEILQTPRPGTDVTHRLVSLFTGSPAPSPNWPAPVPAHPRSTAEPLLDAWLGALVPDPAVVRCRVTAKAGAVALTADVTLADLRLTPLDLLSLAEAADQPQRSELEQRVIYAAQGNAAAGTLPPDVTDIAVIFDRATLGLGATERSFPELLVFLRAARDLLANARPLMPTDLVEPDLAAAALNDTIDLAALETRAADALTALGAARDDLDAKRALAAGVAPTPQQLTDLRTSLLTASLFGIPGAIPANAKQVANTADPAYSAAAQALTSQASAVVSAMNKRYDAAKSAYDGWNAAETRVSVRSERATGLARRVFGSSFLLLWTFRPSAQAATAFDTARGHASTRLGADALAIPRWLQQLTHIRAGASRFDMFTTSAALLKDTRSPVLTIAQLPDDAAQQWVGLPSAPVPPGVLSIVTDLRTAYDRTLPHAGLMYDQWSERVPANEQTTGVAFHYDRPGSRAPNALLLAVSPDPTIESWSDDLILAILNETLELARVRAVDLDSVAEVGQLVPALYFPFNPDGQAVSVDVVEIN